MKTLFLANALLTNTEGKLLVVRKQHSPFYMMPGGKIEAGETPFETLQRELVEELDLSIRSEDAVYLGKHTAIAVNEANTRVHSTIYHVHTSRNYFRALAEIAEVQWLSKTDYQSYRLAHLLEEFSLPIWLQMP